MPFSPSHLTKPKLPKFQSPDKGLEDALNMLARAIESIEIPDIRLTNGNMAWSGRNLLLTPDFTPVKQQDTRIPPLTIVGTRPAYIPEPATPTPTGSRRFWITWGSINNRILTNWDQAITVPTGSNGTKFIVLKVDLAPTDSELVTSATWEMWNSSTEKTSPNWVANGNRPSHYYIMLGSIIVNNGAVNITNGAGGSIVVTDHVSNITSTGGAGLNFTKNLTYTRLPY
jgi:hypothetical protein